MILPPQQNTYLPRVTLRGTHHTFKATSNGTLPIPVHWEWLILTFLLHPFCNSSSSGMHPLPQRKVLTRPIFKGFFLILALEVEGIFRRSANMKTVKEFCVMFNEG